MAGSTLHQPVGGFLPLELASPSARRWPWPADAVLLDSGRSALRALLACLRPERVHLPALSCSALTRAVAAEGATVVPYPLTADLVPGDLSGVEADDVVVVVDLFGLVGDRIAAWADLPGHVVFDHAHALWRPPVRPERCSTIWSPRKSLGLADGGVLTTPLPVAVPAGPDRSTHRYAARLQRRDDGPERAYETYLRAERSLGDGHGLGMSPLTAQLLAATDPLDVGHRRRRNHRRLRDALAARGLHPAFPQPDGVPFALPVWAPDDEARERLRRRGVFLPTWWAEARDHLPAASVEAAVVDRLLTLPIDQHLDPGTIDALADVVADEVWPA